MNKTLNKKGRDGEFFPAGAWGGFPRHGRDGRDGENLKRV